MTSGLNFSSAKRDGIPLQVFLKENHALYVAAPGRLLKPLVQYLEKLHGEGESHGAMMPSCLHVSESGIVDLDFLHARKGSADRIEALTYYPNGKGSSIEMQQRNDVGALAAVIHLIVADQPPARRERRVQSLQEQPSSEDWPEEFIVMIDRILDAGVDDSLPSLVELSTSLSDQPPETPPVIPEPAAEVTPSMPPTEVQAPAPAPQPPQAPVLPPTPVPSLSKIRLPNAMVGRDLDVKIAPLLGDKCSEVTGIEISSGMPDGLELRDGVLTGTPLQAGDFLLDLSVFLLKPSAIHPEPVRLPLSLIVNPDPQSLWKNLSSDVDGEFWKPDECIETLPDGPITVIGASLRGRSHAHVGCFRDDDMAMAWFPNSQWYSLTVADGAGSAKYSRRGSQIACATVKSHFHKNFQEDAGNTLSGLVGEWAAAIDDSTAAARVKNELYSQFGTAAINARKAIEDEATALSASSRDFHTTLITALLHPLPDGRWFIAAFSVGDGAAAIVSVPGGAPCLLTRPDGGEFAGQTVFITMKEALATYEGIMERIQMFIVPSFEALLLVTDGISDPRFDSDDLLADPGAWNFLWNEIRTSAATASSPEDAASAMLRWMGFHSPGHHDDRTVVLASPHFPFSPS